MTNRIKRRVLICLVGSTVSLSGCSFGNPSYNGQINFIGELGIENGVFVMEGEIVNSGSSTDTFDDVAVYLYEESGEQIERVDIGELSGSLSISISSQQIPEYIILDSPDFWDTPKVVVDYYTRSGSGNYDEHVATDRSELPVQPPAS